MIPYKIIETKARGAALSQEEITEFINAYNQGELPDYQMSALLMAIFIQGMGRDEILALTRVMLESGEKMDFSTAPDFVGDKHSTGGVGDKISILLAPILAALDMHIPMISGRGLGHSGGTLDKLESIPGFNVNLDLHTWRQLVLENHLGLIGQTGNICPADKKLYALRDVTATVRSIPLISASIMSKKIAEGIRGLVLDVKTGNGAFMQSMKEARALADSLVSIGTDYGIQTTALITDMNQPLGHAIGNWLEIKESVAGLQGKGPADVMELTYALGAELLLMADKNLNWESAVQRQKTVVENGSAFEKFLEITHLQGGDTRVLQDPGRMPEARHKHIFCANREGYLGRIDTMALGFAGIELGAGRKVITDRIDYTAGFMMHQKLGAHLQAGDPIIEIHAGHAAALERVLPMLDDIFHIQSEPVEIPLLIKERISSP